MTSPVQLRYLGRELVRELGVVDSAANANELSLTQAHVLVELEQNGVMTANELSDRLIVDKSAISRTVAQLLDAGLISTKDDAADKRRKPLAITAKGVRKVEKIHTVANARVKETLQFLNEEDLATTIKGLSLYVKALKRSRTQNSTNL